MQAKRQPGSAFKPFLYSAALEQGFTPASIVNDAPLVIEDPTLEGSWRPQNDTREFRGPMRLREALVRSRNLVSIRVMNALGPAYATQYIERFGFPKNSLPRNLSLALGTAQVSPLEMASGVLGVRERRLPRRAVLPRTHRRPGRQGRLRSAAALRVPGVRAAASAGEGERAARTSCCDAPIRAPSNDETRWGGLTYLQEQWLAPQVISPQNDFLMTDMMSDVIRRGTAARALQLKRSDLAGKTGTTNDRRDAWFCGFNAGLVGDRLGRLRPGALARSGRGRRPHGAADVDIFHGGGAARACRSSAAPAPPGLVSMRISADTGLAARPGEPNAIFETFMAGHLPRGSRSSTARCGEGRREALGRARSKERQTSLF